MKVIFMGTPDFAVGTLEALIGAGPVHGPDASPLPLFRERLNSLRLQFPYPMFQESSDLPQYMEFRPHQSLRFSSKKCQVFIRNAFGWTVKSQRRTRGTFMSALSNKSFSHHKCVEATLPFRAVAYHRTESRYCRYPTPSRFPRNPLLSPYKIQIPFLLSPFHRCRPLCD